MKENTKTTGRYRGKIGRDKENKGWKRMKGYKLMIGVDVVALLGILAGSVYTAATMAPGVGIVTNKGLQFTVGMIGLLLLSTVTKHIIRQRDEKRKEVLVTGTVQKLSGENDAEILVKMETKKTEVYVVKAIDTLYEIEVNKKTGAVTNIASFKELDGDAVHGTVASA